MIDAGIRIPDLHSSQVDYMIQPSSILHPRPKYLGKAEFNSIHVPTQFTANH